MRQRRRIFGRASSRAVAISWPDMLPEATDGVFFEGALFEEVVADAFIGRQQSSLPELSSLIRGSSRKVNEVTFEADTYPG